MKVKSVFGSLPEGMTVQQLKDICSMYGLSLAIHGAQLSLVGPLGRWETERDVLEDVYSSWSRERLSTEEIGYTSHLAQVTSFSSITQIRAVSPTPDLCINGELPQWLPWRETPMRRAAVRATGFTKRKD